MSAPPPPPTGAARALDEIPLDTDTELELVAEDGPSAELEVDPVVETTDELDLDAPEVEALEGEPTRVANLSEPPSVAAAAEVAPDSSTAVPTSETAADATSEASPEPEADPPLGAAEASSTAPSPAPSPDGGGPRAPSAQVAIGTPPSDDPSLSADSETLAEVSPSAPDGSNVEATDVESDAEATADGKPVVVRGMVRVSTVPPPPGSAEEDELALAPDDGSGETPLDDDDEAFVPLERVPTLPHAELRGIEDEDDDEPELTLEDDALEDGDDAFDEDDADELELDDDAEELELHKVAPPPPPGEEGAEASVEPAAAEPPSQRPRETKPRRRPWFETFFSDDYLRTVRPPTHKDIVRECDFIVGRLGLAAGATILDVGCGLGLHAIELTRRGFLVVGLDLSLPMLSRAGDEAQDENVKINFLHGDMREMNFDGAFDAVLCWGTTFGYFDDETNKRVVARLHRALKPRGVLLLDVVNRDYVIRSQPNLIWFEGDGCLCMEESKFNYFLSRLEVKRTVMLDDGRQREGVYTLRLYALHELGLLLHQQGFRVAEVSGWMATPGVFFGADSPRILILAERRVDEPERGKKSEGDAPSKPPPAPGVPPTDD